MQLTSAEVHVWLVWIRAGRDFPDALNADERERARKIRCNDERRRFVVARTALRELLAHYLDIAPRNLEFTSNVNGKPELAHPAADGARPCFNVSHSGRLAAIAVCSDRDVGVDVERIAADRATRAVVARTLSRHESARLRGLARDTQPEAFFRAWTAKEAYLKARGLGLFERLHDLELRVACDAPSCLQPANGGISGTEGWGLCVLPLRSRYAGAVVAAGHDWQLRVGAWDSHRRSIASNGGWQCGWPGGC